MTTNTPTIPNAPIPTPTPTPPDAQAPVQYETGKGCLGILAITAAVAIITVALALLFGDFQ